MTDTFIRHLVAALGTLVCLIIYVIAYSAGVKGWWWTFPGIFVIYYILYHLIEA